MTVGRAAVLRAALLASVVGLLALPVEGEPPSADGWRPFAATWTLTGHREVLPTEGGRPASVVVLSGPLTLTSGEGLGRGLLGQIIGFDDGGATLVGRAVFTDEHGDHIYATVSAQPLGGGRKATATLTGGTGRFAGIEGSFSFSWEYVLHPESGDVDGRITDLQGRTRMGRSAPGERPR